MAKLIINKRLVSVQCGSSGVDLHHALSLSLTRRPVPLASCLLYNNGLLATIFVYPPIGEYLPRTEYLLDGSGEPNIELCCDHVRLRAQ